MKIITNRRFFLNYCNDYQIQDFYTIKSNNEENIFPTCEADFVYLMFSDDLFSEENIDLINESTRILSNISHSSPLYLAGIGCKFKTEEDFFHISVKLLEAIKNFLNEVFLHTNIVGVREKNTYEFLSKIVSESSNKFKIIFEKDKTRAHNTKLIVDFFNSIKASVPSELINSCFVYNKKPFKAFDILQNVFKKDIIVSKPYISSENNKCYLNSDISINGKKKKLWVCVDNEYKEYLDLETSDAFLLALIPYALRTNHDIVMEFPVSDEFLHNVNEYLLPNLYASDPRFYRIKIYAKVTTLKKRGEAVGCGLSCGIDSFYSLAKYYSDDYPSLKPTHIYVGNYFDEDTDINYIHDKVYKTASKLNLPVVKTNSNISSLYNRFIHVYVHFFKIIFAVYTLRNLFRTYIYATATSHEQYTINGCSTLDTAKYELLLVATCNTSSFHIIESGAGYPRHIKTRKITNFEPSYETLDVCLDTSKPNNCGVCKKCLRTLFALDLYDSLDKYSAVFDIENYKNNRKRYFKMFNNCDNNIFLKELYPGLKKKYPTLFK